jgi:hypothetical protein
MREMRGDWLWGISRRRICFDAGKAPCPASQAGQYLIYRFDRDCQEKNE